MPHCRLIVDGPAAGAWNMAVDELLLEEAASAERATLRFYEWSQPTLSLGYFQPIAQRAAHLPSRNCAIVRRCTGGGAILHDRELTYSLTLPSKHPLAADTIALYRKLHGALVAALGSLGAEAAINETRCGHAPDHEPFLCFERREVGDVLIGRAKIAGSAQRRRHGGLLQHGSVLLARSQAAPELPGVEELTGRPLRPAELRGVWRNELADRLELRFEPATLDGQQRRRVEAIAAERYADAGWTGKR